MELGEYRIGLDRFELLGGDSEKSLLLLLLVFLELRLRRRIEVLQGRLQQQL